MDNPVYQRKPGAVDLLTEMITLLKLIDAEFRSDPSSVACFDLSIVKRVEKVILEYDKMTQAPLGRY